MIVLVIISLTSYIIFNLVCPHFNCMIVLFIMIVYSLCYSVNALLVIIHHDKLLLRLEQ